MGKKRRTFTAEFKMKAIEMYLHRGMGSKRIGKELDITYSIVDRWIAYYKKEGLIGLQEKRGKASGTTQDSSNTNDEKIERLEAENAYLKKLLEVKKEMKLTEKRQ